MGFRCLNRRIILKMIIFQMIVNIVILYSLNLTRTHDSTVGVRIETSDSTIGPRIVDSDVVARNDFYVITTVFNPLSYKTRYSLYRRFEAHIKSFGIQLITVELIHGNQTFQVTSADNPNHLQLKTDFILWYKENLINIAIKHLPNKCKYVAWIDSDLEFLNKNLIQDTIEALKRYKIVQLFQYANFLGSNLQVQHIDAGFGYYYATGKPYKASWDSYKTFYDNGTEIVNEKSENGTKCYWHSGFGWAAETETVLKMNGLLDVCILGGADFIMSYSFIDRTIDSLALKPNQYFRDVIFKWSQSIQPIIQKQVGYIPGDINHFWHGSVQNRQYQKREKILHGGQILYNPKIHLSYNQQNLITLADDFKTYLGSKTEIFFKNRNEDMLE